MDENFLDLADRYLAARARVEALNAELKQATTEKDAAEIALVDAMVFAGVTGFKTADGVGLRAQRDYRWSCPAEHRDALYAELRKHPELQFMFTVQPQTLQRFAKDMFETHGEIPEPYSQWLTVYEPVSIRVEGFKNWKGRPSA